MLLARKQVKMMQLEDGDADSVFQWWMEDTTLPGNMSCLLMMIPMYYDYYIID